MKKEINTKIKRNVKRAIKTVNNITLLRILLLVAALLLQMFLIFGALRILNDSYVYYTLLSSLFGLILSIGIVNNRSNPGYKIAWIILILFLPIFGSVIYVILGTFYMPKKVRVALSNAESNVRRYLSKDMKSLDFIENVDMPVANQLRYLQSFVGCPVYKDTGSDFLSPGEVKFEVMKKELLKAEKFIFLEYFIVSNGRMWQEVFDILIEKAKSGVEIRLMYDDFGSLMTLPYKYERYLSQYGIKSCVFGKLVPIWSVLINNRDHRKILVVDGKVGITGGINIADEYINDYEKHGYWKDSSVIIRGESVWSLTVFFLSSWGYVNGVNEDYTKYRFHQPDDSSDIKNMPQSGLVLPYLDSPLDKEPVGQNVYLNIINRAERYVYIETPYLVIDNEMMNALCNAAKQGIDVRIVTPHIPDHWYVHAVSKSNYMQLIESKVKIYEFTPGFIHSKIFICDDKISVVGTINMDYRSLFLHFEDAVFFYKSALIKDIYKDFMDILDKSQEITLDWCRSTPWYRKLGRAILKVFAPLM